MQFDAVFSIFLSSKLCEQLLQNLFFFKANVLRGNL